MSVPITSILERFAIMTINYLPNLVAAIVLLVIGLLVGKVVGIVVKEVLVRLKIDEYLPLRKKKVTSASEIFSIISRWWIYLAFISAALSEQVLGVPVIANWVASIMNFIPNIIGAAIIIIVGYLLGEFIGNELKKSETQYGSLVGKVIFFFIMYVAIAIALPILGISTTLVENILLIIIGSIGLGLAIAIGLGLKDVITEIAKKYVKENRK
ncbi:MAG: hypothetical protein QXJ96_02155 [Candidatus Aenigmatarchaeota archaeon]|nr:hypothetical protein [Candidatus Aenigmarchaeota archaeon]